MSNKNYIVVWDPEAEFWPGGLVDSYKARQLEHRGVALLPVEPKLMKLSGVGGYAYRPWGAGWPLETSVPKAHAPLTMYCVSEYSVIHWKARLVSDPGFSAEGPFEGILRLVGDAGQVNPLKLGVTADTRNPHADMRQLGKPDAAGGWTIGGNVLARIPVDGHYGLCLYGGATGLRVVWAAASQAQNA